jgi:hypothetical protein
MGRLFGEGGFVDEETEGSGDVPLALTWPAAADDTISQMQLQFLALGPVEG